MSSFDIPISVEKELYLQNLVEVEYRDRPLAVEGDRRCRHCSLATAIACTNLFCSIFRVLRFFQTSADCYFADAYELPPSIGNQLSRPHAGNPKPT